LYSTKYNKPTKITCFISTCKNFAGKKQKAKEKSENNKETMGHPASAATN